MAILNLAALAASLSLLVAHSNAQSSIVTLRLPDFDEQAIEASVITANPTATSYLLTCPTDEPDDECGLGAGIEVLEGPSTLEVHLTIDDSSVDTTCTIDGDTAACSTSENLSTGGSSTATTTYTGISTWSLPVTVTAGLDLLGSGGSSAGGSTSSSAGGSTSSAPSSSSGATPTGASPTGASPTGPVSKTTTAATGTGAAQTSSPKSAGMAAVTGNAIVAGVAAVLGAGMFVV